MKTEKIDMSIRIKKSFVPHESGAFTFDALIVYGFFKSRERAVSWWSANAAATRKAGGDVLQADAPQLQKGDVWPWSVRVIKRAPEEYKRIAMAMRVKSEVTIQTTELLEGQSGSPKEVR